jgi:probable rRNA maturation factor
MPDRLDVDVTLDWDTAGGEPLLPDDDVESLLTTALKLENQSGSWAFALRFVDDVEMGRLHEMWLGDPTPTDIMTFPYDDADGEQGGDILISVDTADTNAREHGWDTGEELRFLALHGLLHILGWDDHEDADRRAMLERQHALLTAWRADGRDRER